MSTFQAFYRCFFLVVTLSDNITLAEVISDVLSSESVEDRALEVRAKQFWSAIKSVADNMNLEEHVNLYSEAEQSLKDLSPEHSYVRETLSESLLRLQRADAIVFKQGLESAGIAAAELEAVGKPSSKETGGTSWLRSGSQQGILRKALGLFIDGRYADDLREQVEERQASLLPMLRGAADVTGNVLEDCRLATRLAFDVQKYDIYNKGVPKTPEAAKEVSKKIVEASSQTRKRFMNFVMSMVGSLVDDMKAKTTTASATVVQAELQTTEEGSLQSTAQEASSDIKDLDKTTNIAVEADLPSDDESERWVCADKSSKTTVDSDDLQLSVEKKESVSSTLQPTEEETEGLFSGL
jgi:hypothetical protein